MIPCFLESLTSQEMLSYQIFISPPRIQLYEEPILHYFSDFFYGRFLLCKIYKSALSNVALMGTMMLVVYVIVGQ